MLKIVVLLLLSFVLYGYMWATSDNYYEDLLQITVNELEVLLNPDPTVCRYIKQRNNAWWIENTCNYCIDVYVEWLPRDRSACADASNNFRVPAYKEWYTRVGTSYCRPGRTNENQCR